MSGTLSLVLRHKVGGAEPTPLGAPPVFTQGGIGATALSEEVQNPLTVCVVLHLRLLGFSNQLQEELDVGHPTGLVLYRWRPQYV